MNLCGECRGEVSESDRLSCIICKKRFHYRCLNMTKENYVKMSSKTKAAWRCHVCRVTLTKGDNTPVRSATIPARISPNVATDDSGLNQLLDKRFDELQESLVAHLNVTVKSLIKSEFATLHKDVQIVHDLKNSVEFMSAQYDEMKREITKKLSEVEELRRENLQLRESVQDLGSRLAQIEQKSRECNLEIQCIPEHSSENLENLIVQLGKVVSCPLEEKDIMSCSRISKVNVTSSRPRSVICTLSSARKRDSMLAACIKFNKNNQTDKLSSAHLGIGGDKKPVYVAEHLSPTNRALNAQARILKKECQYKYLWVRNGRVLLRKDESSPAIWIKNADIISKLRNPK